MNTAQQGANDISQPLKVTELSSPSIGDFENYAASQHRSFVGSGNVAHDHIWPPATTPSPDEVIATAKRHVEAVKTNKNDCLRYIQVLDPATNTVAGGARWAFYPTNAAANARPATVLIDYLDPATTSASEQAFTQRVMAFFLGNRIRDVNGPHAALDLLFTHPDYERRGVASLLVQWGIQEARRQEIKKCCVEASLMGTPMYQKNGFVKLYELRESWQEEFPQKKPLEWDYMERVDD